MEPQSLDEVRPGCYDVARAGEGHGRRRCARLDELPLVPHLLGPHSSATDDIDLSLRPCAGLQRLAHRRVVRRLPRPLHPHGRPRHLGRRARPPTRCAGWRTRAATRSASPRTRPPSATPASTTTTGTRCGRPCADTGTVLSVHLGSSGRLSIPAVDSPPDVMITLQPMNIQSRPRPTCCGRGCSRTFPDHPHRPVGGRHRVDPLLPRPARPHLRHAPRRGPGQDFGGRLPSEVFREHFLTCFISDPVGVELRRGHRHRQHVLGGRLPAQRLHVAQRPRGAGRRCSPSQRRPRRRGAKDDARERHAVVLVRPLRPRAEGGGHRRRPPAARRPATTCRSCPGAPGRSSRREEPRGHSASAPSAVAAAQA